MSTTPTVEMAIVSGSAVAKKKLAKRIVEPIDNSTGLQDLKKLRGVVTNSVLSSITIDQK